MNQTVILQPASPEQRGKPHVLHARIWARDTERLWLVPAAAVAVALIGGLVLTFILNQGEL